MIHKLAIAPINTYIKMGLTELLVKVEETTKKDKSVLTPAELFRFNQIETILIHKQIEYEISQEIRTEQRTAKVLVTLPYAHWQFYLINDDFEFLINLLGKYKVYSNHKEFANKKSISLWIEQIVYIRKKLCIATI